MPRPYEIVVPLGEKTDPVVHVSRPTKRVRFGVEAHWLVVSAEGHWLATGTLIKMASDRLPRVNYLSPVPSGAPEAIHLAVAKAMDKWAKVMDEERRTQERLDLKRAQRVAADQRRAALDAEIAALQTEIESLAQELSP